MKFAGKPLTNLRKMGQKGCPHPTKEGPREYEKILNSIFK